MAVDESRLPQVLPSSVARVDPKSGFPTKATIDNEFMIRNWYLTNVQALDTKLTSVKSQTDNNAADIETEISARTNADEALAQDIEELSATVGDNAATVTTQLAALATTDEAFAASLSEVQAQSAAGTASGKIGWTAIAAPAGMAAAYQLSLQAGTILAGLKLYATSVGASQLVLSASTLVVEDPNAPGGPQQLLTYDSGVGAFNFLVPLLISGQQIGTRAVTNSAYGAFPTGSGDKPFTTRDGAQVAIFASFDGQPSAPVGLLGAGRLQVSRDGAVIRDVPISYYVAGNSGSTSNYSVGTMCFYVDEPPAGAHTYSISNTLNQGPVHILLIEMHR